VLLSETKKKTTVIEPDIIDVFEESS
jgi:hypothetical protein